LLEEIVLDFQSAFDVSEGKRGGNLHMTWKKISLEFKPLSGLQFIPVSYQFQQMFQTEIEMNRRSLHF